MWRFVRRGILAAMFFVVCSPSLRADGVRSFTDRADSFSDKFIDPTDTDPNSVGGNSAFLVSKTLRSDEDHLTRLLTRLDDSEDHHGKAWGWRKDDLHHHHGANGGWNLADQDNDDTSGDSGNAVVLLNTSGKDPSTSGVPEPSVLVLLSTALAAFSLKSLARKTI